MPDDPITIEPHPRDLELQAAMVDFRQFVSPWIQTHKLTANEFSFILATMIHHQARQACVVEYEQTKKEKPA